jgi:DNA-binding response OmpR family regulator/HPt (histidine-containing phosphotransfer) domain-containing protein
MRMLVVEDDSNIAQLIEAILHQESYAVDLAADGQIGLDLSESYEYDVILLDVSLPKRDGISICQAIRSRGDQVPILLLTALDSPADRARGLNAGADDYLGKPFDPAELLARVRALLRRSSNISAPVLTWGELQLDPLAATVTYANQLVTVTPKEYAMLELFLRNSKRVFSCNAILEHLWSYDEAPSEEAIRTHIKGIRQKLRRAGATADCVETVYGIGYRLKPLATNASAPSFPQLVSQGGAQFQEQAQEQIAMLEQLAVRFLNQDLSLDWQITGQEIAHSLAGSLGNFGFPFGTAIARQMEKLLSEPQRMDVEQSQRLYSLVVALRQELAQPAVVNQLPSHDFDQTMLVLLVSTDLDFNLAVQAAASEQGWHLQITTSIATAREQLPHLSLRSLLLGPSLFTLNADHAAQCRTDILQLVVEASKQVPLIPVILNSTTTYPELEHVGICIHLPPTNIPQVMQALELAIAEVESRQTHIMVVDDDPRILAMLTAMLVPWGLKVTTLADPQEFWQVLAVAQPHLVVLDVEMPGISGLELCQAVRNHADWSELPIIFLTAHHEPQVIQEVFAIGADDFVAKPVLEPEIILRILNLLERKRLQKILAQEIVPVAAPPLAETASHRIQVAWAIAQIKDSLTSLQHCCPPNGDLEKQRLWQTAHNQVTQLSELMQYPLSPAFLPAATASPPNNFSKT